MNSYYDESDVPVVTWPPGFVARYDALRAEVRELTKSPSATLTQRLNGKFMVTYTRQGRRFYGPEQADRLQAMVLFMVTCTRAELTGAQA